MAHHHQIESPSSSLSIQLSNKQQSHYRLTFSSRQISLLILGSLLMFTIASIAVAIIAVSPPSSFLIVTQSIFPKAALTPLADRLLAKHPSTSTNSQSESQSDNPYQCSSQPYPPAPRIDYSPLIEHWKMCPLSHQYPYLNQADDSSIERSLDGQRRKYDFPDMNDPEWGSLHQWPDPAYPRVFLIDPSANQLSNQTVYSIIISETVYGAKPGYWTSIATIQLVNSTTGDLIPGDFVQGGHPMPKIDYLLSVANLMTCSDSISSMRQPAEIESSYFFIRLHCPFAMRPDTPANVMRRKWSSSNQSDKQSNNRSNKWAQTEQSFNSSTMIHLHHNQQVSEVRFFHPLFVTADPVGDLTGRWDMNNVNRLMNRIGQLRNENLIPYDKPNWLLIESKGLLSFEQSNNQTKSHSIIQSQLSIPVCMSCVPRVDVTLCSAPLSNNVHGNDFHAHLQYHVALGIQKFVVYDRNAMMSDIVRPYIDSGVVELVPFPLPWRNAITKQLIEKNQYIHSSDQTLALESCRLRAVGVSQWIVHKDFDEWLTFPSNGSFVNQDRSARCYSAEWRRAPESMTRSTGAKKYVHMNVGIDQSDSVDSRGDLPGSWLNNGDDELMHSRDSLYSYFQPDHARSFLARHWSTERPWPAYHCPSPLIAWLTALNDVRLMQIETHIPDRSKPYAHRDEQHHTIPLTPPEHATSDGEPMDHWPTQMSQHLAQKSRWKYFRLCDIIVNGNASNLVLNEQENEGSGAPSDHKLIFDRFPTYSGHLPVRYPKNSKWIARPELQGLFVHNLMNAEEVNKDPQHIDWRAFMQMEPNDIRPCEEIHFKHFKNYPKARGTDPQANIKIEHFHDTWKRIVDNAKPM